MSQNVVIGSGGAIIKVWVVYETINELGHHGALVGVFTDSTLADRASQQRGW